MLMKRTLRRKGGNKTLKALNKLMGIKPKVTHGSVDTGSDADKVGTWHGDPRVKPPVRKPAPPKFTAPPPPSDPAPASAPLSAPASNPSTPPRSESPPLTAAQKLAARKTNVDDIVKGTCQSTDPKIRHFGTQRDVRSGRRLRKRKTHRRRR